MKKTYQITEAGKAVGPVEADPLAGRISDQSPIGKELIGKKIGDEVTIKTPKAEITYIIKSIS